MDLTLSHIISQIVAFLAMLWILKRYGWKPFLNLLDQRKEKIKSEFDSIAKQKGQANHLIDEYNQKLKELETESRHKIQEAIAHGQKIAQEIQEQTEKKAKEILASAKAEVGQELVNARKQFKTDFVNIAVDIAEKILRQKMDEQEQQKLISVFVKEAELK